MEIIIWLLALPSIASADQGVSSDLAILKSGVILFILLVLLLLVKLLAARRLQIKPEGALKITDQLQISPTARLLLVEFSGKRRLLGLSSTGFSCLGEVQE